MEITANLWNHQGECLNWQRQRDHSFNLMDMGEGKTLSTLALIAERHVPLPNLILCPKPALGVWQREMAEHTDGEFYFAAPTDGTLYERAQVVYDKILAWFEHDIPAFIACNFACLDDEAFRATLRHFGWGYMVVDEVHRLRSADGLRSMEAFKVGRNAEYRIGLTGTPMPNSPLDLFGIFRWLDINVFGASFSSFKDRYAVTEETRYGTKVVGYKNQGELRSILDEHSFQTSGDVLDLPETVDAYRWSRLPDDIQERHDDRLDELWKAEHDNEARASIIKCQKIASGWSPIDWETIDTTKEQLFRDTLEDLTREPLVVFANFHEDLDVIRAVLQEGDYSVGEISGRCNDKEAFQEGTLDALAVQIKAGSEAIDLSRASTAVFYSPTWSLGEYQQARKRLHRPGQDDSVTFLHLVLEGTIEERMMEALENKEDIVENVMDRVG